jgi:hypothetical protein
MLISISSDNIEYIEKLKLEGFKEIQSRVRNKNMTTLTNIEVGPFFLVDKNRLPFKKNVNDYYDNSKKQCIHCNDYFHWRSLSAHIRKIHLK